MDNNRYMQLPGITVEELSFLQQISTNLNEAQQQQFFNIYTGKRKSPQDVMLYCLIAIVIPGFQRFMIGHIGWAVLYFFTGGLFFIMTIVDIVNYQKLALEFNKKVAYDSYQLAMMVS